MKNIKNKLKIALIVGASSGLTLASAIGWYEYMAIPAMRDAWQAEAVAHNVAQFNPRTRSFEWMPEGIAYTEPTSLIVENKTKRK